MITELNPDGSRPDEVQGPGFIPQPPSPVPSSMVDTIREALKKVEDPEIHMDIITLNLVYDIQAQDDRASIVMTFTTPLCPFGPALVDEVRRTIQAVPGISTVDVKVTFTPPWEPTPEIRMMLGI